MLFSMAFMNGFMVQMVDNNIETALGHIAIHEKGYQNNPKLKANFNAEKSIINAIDQNKDIISQTKRVKATAFLTSADDSRGVMLVGINPETEVKVSNIHNYMILEDEGSVYLKNTTEKNIMISQGTSDFLQTGLGEIITVTFVDINNERQSEGFRITGIFQTPIDTFDKNIAFVGIDILQKSTNIENNISEINIITSDRENVKVIQDRLATTINDDNLEILTWKDMAPKLVKSIETFDQMVFVFFGIIFVTVIFSIVNTLIMAIMERFHEIGVMKCIGTSPMKIFNMVVFEALSLGFVGLLMGVGFGGALILILATTGVDFSFYMESMRTWGSGSIIYPALRLYDLFAAVIIVFITTLVAAIYPAIKAARIKPLEALHHT